MVGVGQISLDQVGIAAPLPRPAGKARMQAWHERPGGQVATALLAAARLGRTTSFVGTVGDDDAADVVLDPLRAAGVALQHVRRVSGAATQRAMIWIDAATGERTVFWHREEGLALAPGEVPAALVATAGVLLVDAGDPAASLAAAQVARDAGRPVVLDADGEQNGLDELLAVADFPILSSELALARFGGEEAAVRKLAARARLAVVTLGVEGAIACDGDRLHRSPALAIAAVDTTGAGDAFHGAFCDAVFRGLGADAALSWSNAAAGLSCTGLGAQGGLPTHQEIERALGSGS